MRGWLPGTVRRWLDLIGAVLTVASIVAFAATSRYILAWVAIGLLLTLVVSLALTAREEHTARVKAESRTHPPPGGGVPLVAPVDYQVAALRQVIARISETTTGFSRSTVDGVLQNLPRSHTDPIYEPLMAGTCQQGLAWLAEHGELVDLGGSWIIRDRERGFG